MYDASSRQDVRRAEKAAKIAERQRAEVITSILSTTAGREWMYDRLSFCQVFQSTFTGDPMSGAFGEGKRSVGLSLLADIMKACPDQYILMAREANERSTAAERSSQPDTDGGDQGAEPDYAGAGEESRDTAH